MANFYSKSKASYVKDLFTRIAARYDRANRWMTLGQDQKWRQTLVELANLHPGDVLLDIGSGTGDIAIKAIGSHPSIFAIGIDFVPTMLRLARDKPGGASVGWVGGDALALPFPSQSFDAVLSGYLLRNVAHVGAALEEQYRVLKPGGRFVTLDTTPIPADLWHLPVRGYTRLIVPLIGFIIAGDFKSYTYLPDSTRQFLTAPALASCMIDVGFVDVNFRRFMSGTMAIHWGSK